MASKLRLITDLYGETLTQISKNPDDWMSFLECAAMNYKYPFNDQVLIYAQRPEAVACAKIEAWNKQVGRWVNRGAKGIALLSEDNGYTNLRYVFDIADTNSKFGKSFRLWSVPKPYEVDIIESLENRYGELEDKSSLGLAIKSVSKILVEDNMQDYLEDLKFYRENSSLEPMTDEAVQLLFQNALENSIAFSMIKRCGLNPNDYFTNEDFTPILAFDSYETITRLGVATSEISEMGIREIYNTIKKLRINEINKIRTFDIDKDLFYDVSESRETVERRNNDEYNLHTQRGLRDTRPSDTREQDSSGGQIRNDEVKILEREQEISIHDSINEQSTSRTLDEYSRSSNGESRTDSIRNESQREDNRTNETTRPYEMDRLNEQLEDISRGDSSERIDLRLNNYDPSQSKTHYVVVDEKINQILSTTPHLRKSNKEIKDFIQNEKDVTKRVEYLKGIFNKDYTGVIVDDQMYGYKTFDNGILFWKGNFLSRDTESFVSWEDLTYHYDAMILLNQLSDRSAYKIIEDSLNLKDTRIYDYYEDENGKRVAELNKKETAIAQAKQEQIKLAFEEWIWKDPERRERLTKVYNERFNSIRPREYDGSHISFDGMNPEITLRKHQVNAIARILYGGNTLLAHEVGAGKTFEMVAAAMESKRLGLCNKSLFVVPNHIVEQFGQEFLQLYPSANVLVTTKKDFETANRKKFCSRIATGDYDAIIISHSQFEKIPMSVERQVAIIQKQIEDITLGIQDLKNNNGERFSIKQMEKTKKGLETRLAKLNDTSRKDDVVTFEELGVDRIFVDEAHYYKNLFLYTKMRNVGGIAQTEAQKSSDLFMKCRYLDELTGGKGVIFATGTPISNSMVELYTMQRYLQYGELEKRHLQQFDAWASTFGETVTAIELSPEGYTLVGR